MRLESVTDATLVQQARCGDKGAFGELISRHLDTARALTARVLGDPELAWDAAQEAAVLALVSLERLSMPERFGAWLCGIALNVARRWVRQLRPVWTSDVVDRADPRPGPDEIAAAAVLSRNVRRAIAGLAAGQRDAVFLFYLQGLTHREVAAELDITVGAVKARLHQARAVLAPRLATEYDKEHFMTEKQALVDVAVSEVRRSGGDQTRPTHLVVLQETAGTRQLIIWIGPAEATALALTLESEQMPRPMTYQFAVNLLGAAGTKVQEVRISQLDGTIYYASVLLDGPAGRQSVDARPSDVINLAVILNAPIRVEESLLTAADVRRTEMDQKYPTSTAELAAEFQASMTRSVRDLEEPS